MRVGEEQPWREKARPHLRPRDRLHAGVERLRGAALPILQTALAAGLAWFAAALILGDARPLFASIVAVISLSIAVSQRGRRMVEIIVAVTLGIIIAGVLVGFFGVGPVQVAVVVALAMVAAAFFGGSELMVNEAAISATILLVAFQPEGTSFSPERLLEALIGGGVALMVNALLPVNPEPLVERASHPLFEGLVAVLEETARALAEGDPQRAESAFLGARQLDERVRAFKQALSAGQETARLSPPRRRALGHLELYASVAEHVDLTARNVRGITRAAFNVTRPDEPAPERLSQAILDLSKGIEEFAAHLSTPDYSGAGHRETARRYALRAAGSATALLRESDERARDLAANVLVGQIRSAAVDLLGGTGLSRPEALEKIEAAVSDSG